ncbi:MAG TPA: Fur family transcriptional regulator [Pseudonocardia sp.]|uniref:Fur family transcriptional regulator n=1 Tax=Pseudonocardia sp. TaxID=60912 RepID=UPI002CF90938|nr:Fur family transcriptional regulator [Pseudonocardia sp.]HTF45956.1 Fur family transcriptional regulator [Pseudonocardia sp.]
MDVQRAAELSHRLREHGLRATEPRMDVLAALEDLGEHRSADEVRDRLAAEGRRLPRSSVYNVLTSLVGAGLALTADAGPGPVLYEAGREWHHHFVCRSCHRVFDVECLVGARPCLTPGTAVGVVEEAQVIFRGICTACGTQAQ